MCSLQQTPYFFHGIFPIFIEQKTKKMRFGSKIKIWKKKNFFWWLWAATAWLQYCQNPKIRQVFWALITSKHSQYGTFSEQLKALEMLFLPDFHFDAQERRRDLPASWAKSRLRSWALKWKSGKNNISKALSCSEKVPYWLCLDVIWVPK